MKRDDLPSPPNFVDDFGRHLLLIGGPLLLFNISRAYFVYDFQRVCLALLASLGPAIAAHCTIFRLRQRRDAKRADEGQN